MPLFRDRKELGKSRALQRAKVDNVSIIPLKNVLGFSVEDVNSSRCHKSGPASPNQRESNVAFTIFQSWALCAQERFSMQRAMIVKLMAKALIGVWYLPASPAEPHSRPQLPPLPNKLKDIAWVAWGWDCLGIMISNPTFVQTLHTFHDQVAQMI